MWTQSLPVSPLTLKLGVWSSKIGIFCLHRRRLCQYWLRWVWGRVFHIEIEKDDSLTPVRQSTRLESSSTSPKTSLVLDITHIFWLPQGEAKIHKHTLSLSFCIFRADYRRWQKGVKLCVKWCAKSCDVLAIIARRISYDYTHSFSFVPNTAHFVHLGRPKRKLRNGMIDEADVCSFCMASSAVSREIN